MNNEKIASHLARIESEETCCGVCFDSLAEKSSSEKAYLLECSHAFCVLCLEQWFEVSSTCPLCRTVVTEYAYNVKSSTEYSITEVPIAAFVSEQYLQPSESYIEDMLFFEEYLAEIGNDLNEFNHEEFFRNYFSIESLDLEVDVYSIHPAAPFHEPDHNALLVQPIARRNAKRRSRSGSSSSPRQNAERRSRFGSSSSPSRNQNAEQNTRAGASTSVANKRRRIDEVGPMSLGYRAGLPPILDMLIAI